MGYDEATHKQDSVQDTEGGWLDPHEGPDAAPPEDVTLNSLSDDINQEVLRLLDSGPEGFEYIQHLSRIGRQPALAAAARHYLAHARATQRPWSLLLPLDDYFLLRRLAHRIEQYAWQEWMARSRATGEFLYGVKGIDDEALQSEHYMLDEAVVVLYRRMSQSHQSPLRAGHRICEAFNISKAAMMDLWALGWRLTYLVSATINLYTLRLATRRFVRNYAPLINHDPQLNPSWSVQPSSQTEQPQRTTPVGHPIRRSIWPQAHGPAHPPLRLRRPVSHPQGPAHQQTHRHRALGLPRRGSALQARMGHLRPRHGQVPRGAQRTLQREHHLQGFSRREAG